MTQRFPVLALAALVAVALAACDSGTTTPANDVLTDGTADQGTDTDTSTDAPADAVGDTPAESGDTSGETEDDVAGDTGSDTGSDTGPDAPLPQPARLRALHLSPDGPTVSVYLDRATPPAVDLLSFPSSTAWLELDAATYRLDIAPIGAGLAGTHVLTVESLPLAAGTGHTAVVFDAEATMKIAVLEDNLTPPATGTVRVRAFHAAAGVGPVDVYALPPTGAPQSIYPGLLFGAETGYIQVPAGAARYGIDVDADGTPDATFTPPTLAAGTTATFFVVKTAGGFFLLIQPTDGPTTRVDADYVAPALTHVRMVHLAPLEAPFDVFENGNPNAVATNLQFLNGTYGIQRPAGDNTYDFAPNGVGIAGTSLSSGPVTLAADRKYTLVAFGTKDVSQGTKLIEDAADDVPADAIRFSVIHVAEGAGTVNVWANAPGGNQPVLATYLGYGEVAEPFDALPDTATITIDENYDGLIDKTFTLFPIPAGTLVNVFIVRQDAGIFLALQFPNGSVGRIDADLGPA
jgi:hypothetical protein